jgi:hypothetical protein
MPKKEMEEDGSERIMDEAGLSFAVEGNFDRSKTKQLAVVGVYETCGGEKGTFLLVIDKDTSRIRFVDGSPSNAQFAVLATQKSDIVMLFCMECDNSATLRWNAKKKVFVWE